MGYTYKKVLECLCDRDGCGHKWITRSDQLPKVCPRCKSRDWHQNKNLVDEMNELQIKHAGARLELATSEPITRETIESLREIGHQRITNAGTDPEEPEYGLPIEGA